MKILKRTLLVLFLLLMFLFSAAYLYTRSIAPDYEGTLNIDGLKEPVEVYFDDYAIPHIYAKNQGDLYLAFGYLHAQERLWQMDLLRRIAPGRLSEFFGPDMVEIDKFFRTLSIDQYSEKMANQLQNGGNEEVLSAAEQYLKGINYFVENGYTPIEYTLAGLEKSEFDLKDIYNVIGYMSFSFAHAQKFDPWATAMLDKLGPDYMNDLSMTVDPSTTLIQNYPNSEAYMALNTQTQKVLDGLPVPKWLGSNSWVISPGKSATGSVLFANDPHIDYSSPSVWYEAHLSSPEMEIYGYFVAALPFGLLGHNQNMALGLTMFQNDDIDFFREKVNPENSNQYFFHDQLIDFTSREETIKVKGQQDISITVRSSVHGPIINDVIEGMEDLAPTSMWWALTAIDNSMLDVAYALNQANNISEVRQAASMIHAAGLNVMYGDKEGNIAWWASAKLPKRPKHVNSKLVLDGSGPDEYEGFLDFSQNPQAENPPWGYVYSANNQPDTINNELYPGYYLPEDRGRRIVELVESNNNIDVAFMEQMLTDDVNPVSGELKKLLLSEIEPANQNEELFIEVLKNWAGTHELSDQGPIIYDALIYRIMKFALEDEMGSSEMEAFMSTNAYKRSIAKLTQNETSIWWDDTKTIESETRTDIFNRAFSKTAEDLTAKFGKKWNKKMAWGDIHTLEHDHPFGQIKTLRPYFNVGPLKAPSGTEVLNNIGYNLDGDSDYKATFGPSTRRIVDFSNMDNNRSILPTGNSGNIFSRHFKDQAQMYVNGEFRPMHMNIDIIRQFKRKLVLE